MPEPMIDFEQLFFLGPPCIVLKADPPKFTVATVSKAYLYRSGLTLQEFRGKAFFNEFLKHRLERDSESYRVLVASFMRMVATQQPELIPYLHVAVKDANGNPKHSYVRIHNMPVLDEAGALAYIMHSVIDISDAVEDAQRKQSAFELVDGERRKAVQLEERLRLAIDSAQLGTWQFDLSDKQPALSVRAKEILGLGSSDAFSIQDFIMHIDEKYREFSKDAIQAALVEKALIDLEVPFVSYADSKQRWVKITGRLYPGSDGHNGRLVGTILDTTERKLEDLRKNDFITIVSHELKTPLTVIKAYVQMLMAKAKKTTDEMLLASMKKIYIHVEKMRVMISGFLDVARVESGKMELNVERFNLSDVIRQTIEEGDIITKQNPIALDLSDAVIVTADKEKLMQVVANLLSNAIKYSPVGSTIAIRCTIKDNEAVVSVRDNGIGIAPQDREKLFTRFYRVENHTTKNISGFGIGLYLCHEIITCHKGHMWVESAPGDGSAFYFSVPAVVS